MPIYQATFEMKGGTPDPPKAPAPPVPTTVADNVSRDYRLDQAKRARGFSSTILGGREEPTRTQNILGG